MAQIYIGFILFEIIHLLNLLYSPKRYNPLQQNFFFTPTAQISISTSAVYL